MQKWATGDIQAALSEESQSESRVGRLQSILNIIESTYPSVVGRQFIASLSVLEQLVMYNPPDVSGVWISKGVVRSAGSIDAQIVEGHGYSQAESLAGLISDLIITLAVSAVVNPVDGQARYARSVNGSFKGASEIAVEYGTDVPCRHIASRADSTVPASEFICVDRLQKISAACSVAVRQRDAINTALCEQIRHYAMHQWWNQQSSPRMVTSEAEHLFSYYRKRCDQKVNTKREWLLDISPAWGPQVYVAVSMNQHAGDIALGSGCGPGAHKAISNAVLDLRHNEAELYWLSHSCHPVAGFSRGGRAQSVSWLQASFTKRHATLLEPVSPSVREQFWPQRTFVRHVAKKAFEQGLDFFYSDLSARGAPFSIVKVLSSPAKTTRFC